MAIKISSILNVFKGSSNNSSSNKKSNSTSYTKCSSVKTASTKPVSKVSSSTKSMSSKSTSNSTTSTASKVSVKATSNTTYLKDASKLYNSSGVAYSYGRPAFSYGNSQTTISNTKASSHSTVKKSSKLSSSKSTLIKKNETKPQVTQTPVVKKVTVTKSNTDMKTYYLPSDSRSGAGKTVAAKSKVAAGVRESMSLAASFIPYVGDAKDIQEAITGKDLVTGKKISGANRVITIAAAVAPIITASSIRKTKEVVTSPTVKKAVKNGTGKLAMTSSELAGKAKKAISKSGKKGTGAIGDATKKTKSTAKNSVTKGTSKLEDVSKKAVQKGKENATIDVDKYVKEIQYSKASLNTLNNTNNFNHSAIEHIFEGQVNKYGSAVGYHYEGIEGTAGKVVKGTEMPADKYGVYKAKVEVNGTPKKANSGYSTFYDKKMKPQEVIDVINEAYDNKKLISGSRNTYQGVSKNGMKINMYIDKNGKIISAFPER